MKKIKMLLLAIILIFPVIVKADMDAPMTNYKVRVSNPNGANLYRGADWPQNGYVKTDYKVEYDKIVKISEEIIDGDQVYGGHICVDEEQKICGYINLSNTSPIDINLDDYYHENAISYRVFDKTCYLYSGPSSIVYNKINPEKALDVGYTFSTNYYDELWAYIPEKKAWGYYYTYKIGNNHESAGLIYMNYRINILTMEEVKIYDSPKTKENVLAIIPANTKLTTIGQYNMAPRAPFYYVTYNGVTGFIETIRNDEGAIANIAYEESKTLLKVNNNDGVKLYKDSNLNSEVITIIPYDTDLKPFYLLDGWYYTWMYKVKYNDQTGWIENNDHDFISSNIEDTSADISENPSEIIENDVLDNISEKYMIDNTSDKIDIEEKEIINIPDKISISETITICTVIVLLTSLTALITILLINKKKELKNVNKDIDDTN